MKVNLNKELIYIPLPECESDDLTSLVAEIAGSKGEDWDLIFLKDGLVTLNQEADINRVKNLIQEAETYINDMEDLKKRLTD